MKKIFLLSVVVFFSLNIFAQRFALNGITYNKLSDTNCEVVKDYSKEYSGDITIPNSVIYNGEELTVTVIGSYAFQNCTKLTSVTIPNSVVTIKESAFSLCSNLQSFVIPNSVESIDNYAFAYNKSLISIIIPNSVKYIGEAAFTECSSLSEFTVESGSETFASIGGVLFNKSNSSLMAYPIGKAGETYEIPNIVNVINNFAFSTVTNLKSIYIPNSVSVILPYAFNRCWGLNEFSVADDNVFLCDVDGVLFYKDKKRLVSYPLGKSKTVDSYSIPDGTVFVGESAFYGSSLQSITLPESLTLIEAKAFYNSTDLREVNCLSKIPPIGDGDFYSSVYDLATLNVPIGTLVNYQNSVGWSKFKKIQETSGVQNVETESISVLFSNGNIVINGLSDYSEIKLYDLYGRVIYNGQNTIIPIRTSGIYILQIDNKTIRIKIN